mgnify:CR=1 FL=1
MNLHYNVMADRFLEAGEASSSVKRQLKKLGINADIVRRVAIAMYEAEINMVIHANGGEIDVEISPDKIHVILKDTGPGIADIDKAMEEGYPTADAKARQMGFGAGMGLPNMKKFSDDLKITSQVGVGTTVEILIFI